MPSSLTTHSVVYDILKTLFGVAVGAFSVWYYTRRANRHILLKKRIYINRLGFTADNEDWGNIQVLYNNQQSNNINFIVVEIFNDSNRDCEPLTIDFALAEGCVIYQNSAQYYSANGTILDLLQEKEFFDYFQDIRRRYNEALREGIPSDQMPKDLQSEINFITKRRKFVVPAFNKKTKIILKIMAENFNHNNIVQSDVIIDVIQKGITIVPFIEEEQREKEKRKKISIISFLLFTILSLVIAGYSLGTSLTVVLMFINVWLSYYISFPILYGLNWIKKELFE